MQLMAPGRLVAGVMREVSLSTPPVLQATSTVSQFLGQQLYRADVWLQGKGLLGELAPATPKNVREGGLSEEELEVRYCF